ncbi:MAG TPA: RES family NAD+ phosphorylase [Acidiferrobacterales bacterium]|nr:RES family NAD+ phosphorylase [Acidiferrobacterales bacterium]
MLELVGQQFMDLQTFRYAFQVMDEQVLRNMGLDIDAIDEVFQFLNRGRDDSLQEYLDAPFANRKKFSEESRYSDGSYCVFYSALEPETAEAEVKFRQIKRAIGNARNQRTVYYLLFSCQFSGSCKDLRPFLGDFPFLTADNYTECNELGLEAVGEGLDGLVVPSARRLEGTCLPVFKRPALSAPRQERLGAFTYDPASGDVSISALPIEQA